MASIPENIRTPRGVTWDCSGCGTCCKGYEFGPVSEGIIAGLEELEIAKHWPRAAEQPWYQRREDAAGNETIYLSKVDDHCIFLQEDDLCFIHGRFGSEAKPAFCREFPFHTMGDELGMVAIVRADCAGFYKTFTGATPIEQGAAEAVPLPRMIRRRVFEPETVALQPGINTDRATWLQWEEEVLTALEGHCGTPEQGVGIVIDTLNELAGYDKNTPNPDRGNMAIRAVLTAFRMVMDKVLSTPQAGGSPEQVAFAHTMSDWVDLALERAEVGTLPPLTDDAQEYLSVVLRSTLMVRQWEHSASVAEGVGRWLFHVTVCRLLAETDDDGAVTAKAWSACYVKWNRYALNRTIEWAMDKAGPAFIDLYLNRV